MLPASRLSTEFYNIDWVRGLQARISTIMNEWCLQWTKVYNFEGVESTMLPASRLSTEFYNIDWVIGLQARIPTIMNEWCLQWPKVYNFEWVESTMLPASRLSTELYNIDWVRGLQARIPTIMNEWCLPWSEVTSLNKWSQQWYQYQHSWRSEVTHILKSRILNECSDNDPSIQTLYGIL